MSTWLAGRKTFTPMSTSRPPLIFRVTLPETTSPSWCWAITFSQAIIRCAFLCDSTISPVSSSIPSRRTWTLVAGLGRLLVLPLVERDQPFRLVADVDDHLVADDLDDAARDDLADVEVLAIAEEPVEFVRAVLADEDEVAHLFVGDVEFAEEVAIYHV